MEDRKHKLIPSPSRPFGKQASPRPRVITNGISVICNSIRMKTSYKRQITLGLICILVCIFYFTWTKGKEDSLGNQQTSAEREDSERVVLALVSCGDRYEEALTMIKSAVLFSSRTTFLHFVIIVDDETFMVVSDSVELLAADAERGNLGFSYEIKRTWFPPENEETWKTLYAPCSAQRIFFPTMLPHIDRLIYMDTDTFFISDVKELWSHFGKMNESQWIAAANEDELTSDGWYNTKAEIPYYGQRGINSGVMLLNLTRMRLLNIETTAIEVHKIYGKRLRWGDQDILNVILNSHPEYAYNLPCEFNFRTSHCYCRYAGNCSCKSAATRGVQIVHGNLRAFQSPRYPFFRDLFETFRKIPLDPRSMQFLQKRFPEIYKENFKDGHGCVLSNSIFFKNIHVPGQ